MALRSSSCLFSFFSPSRSRSDHGTQKGPRIVHRETLTQGGTCRIRFDIRVSALLFSPALWISLLCCRLAFADPSKSCRRRTPFPDKERTSSRPRSLRPRLDGGSGDTFVPPRIAATYPHKLAPRPARDATQRKGHGQLIASSPLSSSSFFPSFPLSFLLSFLLFTLSRFDLVCLFCFLWLCRFAVCLIVLIPKENEINTQHDTTRASVSLLPSQECECDCDCDCDCGCDPVIL